MCRTHINLPLLSGRRINLSDNTRDSDKSSDVPISHQMSILYLPCTLNDDAHAVATDLKISWFS